MAFGGITSQGWILEWAPWKNGLGGVSSPLSSGAGTLNFSLRVRRWKGALLGVGVQGWLGPEKLAQAGDGQRGHLAKG